MSTYNSPKSFGMRTFTLDLFDSENCQKCTCLKHVCGKNLSCLTLAEKLRFLECLKIENENLKAANKNLVETINLLKMPSIQIENSEDVSKILSSDGFSINKAMHIAELNKKPNLVLAYILDTIKIEMRIKKTQNYYIKAWQEYFEWCEVNKRALISQQTFASYRQSLDSVETSNKKMSVIKKYLKTFIVVNAKKIPALAVRKKISLSTKELDTLKTEILKNGDIELTIYFFLGVNTASRGGAISNIALKDINFLRTDGDLSIRMHDFKSKYFTCSVEQWLADLIKQFISERNLKNYLFYDNECGVNDIFKDSRKNKLYKRLKPLLKIEQSDGNFAYFGFHNIRRTIFTDRVKQGINEVIDREAKNTLKHTSKRTGAFKNYIDIDDVLGKINYDPNNNFSKSLFEKPCKNNNNKRRLKIRNSNNLLGKKRKNIREYCYHDINLSTAENDKSNLLEVMAGRGMELNDDLIFEATQKPTCPNFPAKTMSAYINMKKNTKNGYYANMQIKMRMENDYGIVATGNILKDTILCEYSGVVRNMKEVNTNDAMKYSTLTSIDPSKKGNIARFISGTKNDSETSANAFSELGKINNIPRILLIAKTDIKEGEWLKYNYNAGKDSNPMNTAEYDEY